MDPKTVLCVFYKAGTCEKGNKCKFSHNPDVERKVEKRNVYDDAREQDKSGASPSVLPFTGNSLMALCSGHHGELGRRETSQRGALEAREPTHYYRRLSYPSCSDNPINLSLLQIVCKHFIDAIETQKFVRRFPSNLLPLTCTTQVRVVLGVSERGRKVSIPARPTTRLRSQISTQSSRRRRKGQHNQPGRIPGSRGAC